MAGQRPLKPGKILDNYEVLSVLGTGGFGVTYRATDLKLKMSVVIKEYFPEYAERASNGDIKPKADDQSAKNFQWGLDRFLKEAQTLAGFRHPNIVAVQYYFTANETAYLVMPFEDGTDLEKWLFDRTDPLTEQQMVSIVLPLLDGLKAVHKKKLIHRDIKPANILMRGDGTPVLIDFGSARTMARTANTTLTVLLSHGYSAPEQYQPDARMQGTWTDIYAIGAVMYKMITGKKPSPTLGLSGMPSASEAGSRRYDRRTLDAIDRCLVLIPSDRIQTASELHGILSKVASRTQPASEDDDATYVRSPRDKPGPEKPHPGPPRAAEQGESNKSIARVSSGVPHSKDRTEIETYVRPKEAPESEASMEPSQTSSSNLQIDALQAFESSYANLRFAAAAIRRDLLNPERMSRTSILDGINQLHTHAEKFQKEVLANKSRLHQSLVDAATTYIDALAELNESVRFGLESGLTKPEETTERLNTSLELVRSAENVIDGAVQIVSNEIGTEL